MKEKLSAENERTICFDDFSVVVTHEEWMKMAPSHFWNAPCAMMRFTHEAVELLREKATI